MERNSNPNNTIKLSILDIFPSYEEINPKKEEMFAIFQGLNNFFDLEEILTRNKTKIIEIENNNQSSIIISLIKSNNIIATGFINIKHGEQWITLNYETKNRKISSSLALNLMDCIKLKIFCDLKNKSQTDTVEGVNFDFRLYIPALHRRFSFFRSLETMLSVFEIFIFVFNSFPFAKFNFLYLKILFFSFFFYLTPLLGHSQKYYIPFS